MRAAGNGNEVVRTGAAADGFARGDRTALADSNFLRAGSAAREQHTADGGIDNAENGRCVFDQRDVDGEITVAADKFPCSVERIHQIEARAEIAGHVAAGDFLFRHDGYVRRRPAQSRQDDGFGGVIGFRDRRLVILQREITTISVNAQDFLPGGNGRCFQGGKQGGMIEGREGDGHALKSTTSFDRN